SETTSQITGSVYNTRRARYLGIRESGVRHTTPRFIGWSFFSFEFVYPNQFSVSCLGGGFCLQFFDFHFGNPVSFDLEHCVAVAFILEGLALSWNSLKTG